jgi:hypothetical protein
MKSTQLFLLCSPLRALYVQNTSQAAPLATNPTDGPRGQREVRTTAYTHSRHSMERNARSSEALVG